LRGAMLGCRPLSPPQLHWAVAQRPLVPRLPKEPPCPPQRTGCLWAAAAACACCIQPLRLRCATPVRCLLPCRHALLVRLYCLYRHRRLHVHHPPVEPHRLRGHGGGHSARTALHPAAYIPLHLPSLGGEQVGWGGRWVRPLSLPRLSKGEEGRPQPGLLLRSCPAAAVPSLHAGALPCTASIHPSLPLPLPPSPESFGPVTAALQEALGPDKLCIHDTETEASAARLRRALPPLPAGPAAPSRDSDPVAAGRVALPGPCAYFQPGRGGTHATRTHVHCRHAKKSAHS
jgi:hypothetical protein